MSYKIVFMQKTSNVKQIIETVKVKHCNVLQWIANYFHKLSLSYNWKQKFDRVKTKN